MLGVHGDISWGQNYPTAWNHKERSLSEDELVEQLRHQGNEVRRSLIKVLLTGLDPSLCFSAPKYLCLIISIFLFLFFIWNGGLSNPALCSFATRGMRSSSSIGNWLSFLDFSSVGLCFSIFSGSVSYMAMLCWFWKDWCWHLKKFLSAYVTGS